MHNLNLWIYPLSSTTSLAASTSLATKGQQQMQHQNRGINVQSPPRCSPPAVDVNLINFDGEILGDNNDESVLINAAANKLVLLAIFFVNGSHSTSLHWSMLMSLRMPLVMSTWFTLMSKSLATTTKSLRLLTPTAPAIYFW